MKKAKRMIIVAASLILVAMMMTNLTGCGAFTTEADKVSYNVSQDADNFNVTRRLVVINARSDKPVFELIGNFSIEVDNVDNQLEVVCETGPSQYKKHFIGLNDWVIYNVEDLGGATVNKYKYEINYIPESIMPYTITSKK